MYKVKGSLGGVNIFNTDMMHLPRVGDAVILDGNMCGIVHSVIWDMRNPSDKEQHVSLNMHLKLLGGTK